MAFKEGGGYALQPRQLPWDGVEAWSASITGRHSSNPDPKPAAPRDEPSFIRSNYVSSQPLLPEDIPIQETPGVLTRAVNRLRSGAGVILYLNKQADTSAQVRGSDMIQAPGE